jgi:hypothetical protein
MIWISHANVHVIKGNYNNLRRRENARQPNSSQSFNFLRNSLTTHHFIVICACIPSYTLTNIHIGLMIIKSIAKRFDFKC